MNTGTAMGIFMHIDSPNHTDEEKGLAIYEVCWMPTNNSIRKKDLFAVIEYLLNMVFELPEESEGGGD